MTFEQPLSVSNSLDFDYHSVKVSILEKRFFNAQGGDRLEQLDDKNGPLSMIDRIQMQVDEEWVGGLVTFENTLETVSSATSSAFTLSTFLKIILGFGLDRTLLQFTTL